MTKELINKVEQWFIDRNMQDLDGFAQIDKLREEVEELSDARSIGDPLAEMDAVGDILVVLIGYAKQRRLDILECLNMAYDEIKDRKGKLINGSFVKESDL